MSNLPPAFCIPNGHSMLPYFLPGTLSMWLLPGAFTHPNIHSLPLDSNPNSLGCMCLGLANDNISCCLNYFLVISKVSHIIKNCQKYFPLAEDRKFICTHFSTILALKYITTILALQYITNWNV